MKALRELTPDQLQLYERSLASKLDSRDYRIESSLLVQFMVVGEQLIDVTIANAISSISTSIRINIQAPINGLKFTSFSPPVANKTSNISFTVAQVCGVLFLMTALSFSERHSFDAACINIIILV